MISPPASPGYISLFTAAVDTLNYNTVDRCSHTDIQRFATPVQSDGLTLRHQQYARLYARVSSLSLLGCLL